MALGYEHHTLTTPQDIQHTVKVLQHGQAIAVDTEFIRRRTYYPKLALLQLATNSKSYVIDPLASPDITALHDLLSTKSLLKIFHSSRQDMEIFIHHFNFVPHPIADTQILAQFCGFSENISLQSLCDHFFCISLSKEFQKLDWLQRPLPAKALTYAREDVEYVYHIHQRLKDLAGPKYDWFLEDMHELQDLSFYKETPEKLLGKFKLSTSTLKQEERESLVRILLIRDTLAARMDCLTKEILSDDACYELSLTPQQALPILLEEKLWAQLSHKNLLNISDNNQGFEIDQKQLKIDQKVLKSGQKQLENSKNRGENRAKLALNHLINTVFSQDYCIEKHSNNKPFSKKTLSDLQKTLQDVAATHLLSPTLLARSRDIKAFLAGHPSRLTKGWRAKLLANTL